LKRGGWKAAVNVGMWQNCDLPISDYQTLVYNELTITIHNSSHGVFNCTRSTKRLKNSGVKMAASKKWTKTSVCFCCSSAWRTLTFGRTLWFYNVYNYKKSRPHGIIYISTENRPAAVRLSGGRRAMAARSLNRRPAAVVNGLSPARSQGGGCLITAAALPPNCHLRDILGCHVSRKPLKPTAFCWQFYVTALSDV